MRRKFAVIGHPVAHSLSPQIHAQFAEAAGIDLSYERLLAPLDGFAATVSDFFATGGSGLNVTLPFKEQAFAWVQRHDSYAAQAGAVNTIAREGDGFCGYNTDGLGLVRDLASYLALAGARVLLLGAGGAVRGVLAPLLAAAPAALVLSNRTFSRAQVLAAAFAGPERPLQAVALADLQGPFDLIINGTAASLAGETLALAPALAQGALCYDMAYSAHSAHATAFCQWGQGAGARLVLDGLGMLIEQAAAAFHIWHGLLPDTRQMHAQLRAQIQQQGQHDR